ncbi:ferredoxin-nitrite reductase [Filomicrobium insigne]|uniref:Ferredoxin-nitrite reductase n=1 Tax=Filomicrobium insigne TaxID=418854 RepID=A0A1H0I3W3_9HYPH|nr:NirA family protein [Filomicrobium insigne]SDO26122.1 ferredoxin-nitrite reductase [Filomicrobium insigne]
MSAQDFSDEQKRYLEGFVSGIQTSRAAAGLKPLAGVGGGGAASGPDAEHLEAMARFERDGKKLVNEEKAKRDEHPFDAYKRLKREALGGAFPKGVDNFRWRFHGLYYVAPAQDSFMCRMRIPNGILNHWQFSAVADLAERFGGGYTHVTTRANLQIREIAAENGPPLIEGLAEIGLTPKGSGADNIRNVTGSPTAGIDPQELIDSRPYAKAWHHHILNDRSLYGLPRKFNVAFDGGGAVPVLEDTNDISFTAIRVKGNTETEGGVWFRLGLGGITGHRDFARPTGVFVKPSDAVAVADAIVRVFIANGDRTNRQKARMKYVLDEWGFDKFLTAVEEQLGSPLQRFTDDEVSQPNGQDRQAHIGVHPQSQPGLVWIGVALPVGRLSCDQMRTLADISREFGDGDIRLTVWQNLLISGVSADRAEEVEAQLQSIGLTSKASSIRAGLVACTGNTGCKFAASNTKDTALAIADWVEPRLSLDQPINIHLTGCHHSCAQHYIGDIGLIACRVPIPDSDDTEEGFHILVGGGFGADAAIARELFNEVRIADCPETVGRILAAYMANRAGTQESFAEFSRRHEIDTLKTMAEAAGGLS